MEIVVDMHPFGFRLDLELMSDDTWPCGGIDEDDIGIALFDSLPTFVVCCAKFTPALVLVRSKQRMWMGWHIEAEQDRVLTHRTTSRVSSLGSQQATTLPVPMTDW